MYFVSAKRQSFRYDRRRRARRNIFILYVSVIIFNLHIIIVDPSAGKRRETGSALRNELTRYLIHASAGAVPTITTVEITARGKRFQSASRTARARVPRPAFSKSPRLMIIK